MKTAYDYTNKSDLAKILKQGGYAILTIPFKHRYKSWFTKNGNISKKGIQKFIEKYAR
jgi:hypothetical protein